MFAPPGEGGSSPDCLPYLVVFLAFNLLRIRDVVLVCQLNIISDVERNAVLHGQWLVTSGNARGAEVPKVSAPAPQAACHGGELPVNEGRPMCQKGYGAAASRRSRGGGVAMFIREFSGHIASFRIPAALANCCVVPGGEGCASCVRDEGTLPALYLMPDSSVLACPLASEFGHHV